MDRSTRYGALLLCWLWAGGSAGSAQSAGAELEAIRDFYAAITSVHLKARADFSRTTVTGSAEPATRSGTGTIEYWEVGDRIRSDVRTSPELGLIDDMDVAFDGSVGQVMRHLIVAPGSTERRSYLLLSSGGRQPFPSAFPNPLFLPVDFLRISTENCPGCQPSLDELRDPVVWAKAAADTQVFAGPAGNLTLEVPTGSLLGKPFTYVVDRAPGRALPGRVRHRLADGDERVSIVMAAERTFAAAGRELTFPTRFRIESDPRDGDDGMTVDIVLEELEINGHIDPRVFVLDRAAADMIYDEDTQTFIKAMRSRAEP